MMVPVHTPAAQVWPGPQRWPHLPQLSTSVAAATHQPAHSKVPAGQLLAHTPATHTGLAVPVHKVLRLVQ
jgi:hypothetical protein